MQAKTPNTKSDSYNKTELEVTSVLEFEEINKLFLTVS